MKVKVQVVTITDDGQETIREIACVERQDLDQRAHDVPVAIESARSARHAQW